MVKSAVIKTNGTAGEVSPLIFGRIDISKYPNGFETVENFISLVHGAMRKRGGTRFIANTRNNDLAKLIPFQFSVEQAYVLEFTDSFIRFYRDRARIETGAFSTDFSVDFQINNPIEIASPYLEAELFEIQHAQSADVMYLTHQNHLPRKLTRASDISWTIEEVDFLNGPFDDINTTVTTLTPSATTGNITITASTSLFTVNDVGRLVDFSADTDVPKYAKITGFTSDTVVDATVKVTLPAGATTNWALGTWYIGNSPASVAFFEERLVFAGTPNQPQTLWFSKTGDFENFDDGTGLDDESITYTIATDQVNAVRWLSPGQVLVIGTSGGEFIASGTSTQEALTPTNIRIVRQTNYGSPLRLPIRIASVVLFIQRAFRKVRQFIFQFESDSFVAPDVTVLSEHISESGFNEMTLQQEPNSLAWFVRNDGQLVGMTYLPEQDVIGWHRHILGGTSDTNGASTIAESICAIPEGDTDDLYISAQRYINGSVVRHVEVMDEGLKDDELNVNSFFVDSGLSLDNPITITGITNANPAVVTAPNHSLGNGSRIRIDDVKGMTQINENKYTIQNITTNTFELQGVDTTGYGVYYQGGNARELVTTIFGLSHLEGKEVAVLVDGAAHPNKTVSSGSVVLDFEGAIIHIGLPYIAKLKTLRPESGSLIGTSQGANKRVVDVILRLYRTLGIKAGIPDKEQTITFRNPSDPMDKAVPLFSGDKEFDPIGGYTTEGQISIISDQPLPATITAIIALIQTNQR